MRIHMIMVLLLFAVTLFGSALLLFLVQPMIGKMILPRLGGTPQVWNTCMLFFQLALLAGYTYTHVTTSRLMLRQQLIVHGLLLLVPLAVLLPFSPFNVSGFEPPAGSNPILYVLCYLALLVGLPFFVVGSSAPLLQRWFSHTRHRSAGDPYFLYAASNLGSMIGLLAYPFLVEPFFSLRSQAFDLGSQNWLWATGYVLLALLVVVCIGIVMRDEWRGRRGDGIIPRPSLLAPHPLSLTWQRRSRWVILAAVPSSLMLGITTYIAVDVAAIPLLWVGPLAFYLLSFILVFMRWPLVWTRRPHTAISLVQPALLLAFVIILGAPFKVPDWRTIVLSVLAFFSTALVCHGELARDRPEPLHLTEFYWWIALGGLAGTLFNALLAPVLFFWGMAELPLALVLAGLVRPSVHLLAALPKKDTALLGVVTAFILAILLNLGIPALLACVVLGFLCGYFCLLHWRGTGWTERLLVSCALALLCAFSLYQETDQENVLYRGRTYFGVLRVLASGTGRNALAVTEQEAAVLGVTAGTPKPYTYLMHGTTYHGLNFQSPQALRRQATTYYHRKGPLGIVMEQFNWFNFALDPTTETRKWTPQPDNTYHADARVIASAVGLGCDPCSQLINLWSEPPGAVIGLGVGTMASYARPWQHLVFYEIDDTVKSFSCPGAGGMPCFNYVADARARGAGIEMIMGDARVSLAREEDQHTGYAPHRDHYYHFMVVAAFSSDAVPVHLLTKEAFQLYFDKLADDGILIVNVSNRHVSLAAPVADIAKKLGLAWRVGTDFGYDKSGAVGHFPSEYVILARHEKYLPPETPPEDYDRIALVWRTPTVAGNRVWTDDYSNLLAVLRWGSPGAMTVRGTAPKD